jgi:hypothetical protein
MFTGRKWIGQVQNESVLFSSLEQSSDAIASLISNLQTNPDYAGTAQCLEELLFYRMAKQWKDCANGGLSYFMMMIQEAQALGIKFSNYHLLAEISDSISFRSRFGCPV